jgi:glyoxylase-like metal-dependent hydrolase (beta-lactamase superfamily II)
MNHRIAVKNQIQIGEATVSIFNCGDLVLKLADMMHPRSSWEHSYDEYVNESRLYPSLTIHISLHGNSIIVDPNDYSLSAPPGSEYAPKDYSPPKSIFDQLESSGIQLSKVTHVIITHAHYDHYAGVTRKNSEGKFEPAFPHAQYFLNRADWEWNDIQDQLRDPASEVSNSLGVLKDARVLNLIDGKLDLLPEVTILPAPGESPGHQVLKVNSGGKALYCVGDLVHDHVEVENPTATSSWADFDSNLKSKETIFGMVEVDNAYIVPSHMQLGQLSRDSSGIKWNNV